MAAGHYCNGGTTHANKGGKSAGNSNKLFKPDPTHSGSYYNGGETHANRSGKSGGGGRKFGMPAASTGYHNGGSYRAK